MNTHPSIKWGQKKDHILLTVAVQDIDKPEIDIKPTKFHFKGQQTKGLVYDTLLEFFDEIDPQTSKYRKIGQNHWEFMLQKKDASKPFWKRLTKSKEKCSWIAVDWNHFATEDEDNDEAGPADGPGGAPPGGQDWGNLDAMLKQMGGGMGGPSAANLTGDNDKEIDSDDEPMPDLEDASKSNEEKDKATNQSS